MKLDCAFFINPGDYAAQEICIQTVWSQCDQLLIQQMHENVT